MVVTILLQQNFNRSFRFWQPLVELDAQYVTFLSEQPLIEFAVYWDWGQIDPQLFLLSQGTDINIFF